MPSQHFEEDYARRRPYSPPSTTSSYSSGGRHGRAVQPYRQHPRAVEPYNHSNRQLAHHRSDSHLSSPKPHASRREQGTTFLKDHGAELAGAAVGGYAGHRASPKDAHLKTASGAAVGAIGGAILERGYRKWTDKREDKKVGREVRRRRDSPYSSDGGYSSDGYDYPPPARYSRSMDRGRERDRTPGGWRDMGRQLKRSLSRKRVDAKQGMREDIRDHDEHPRSWRDVGREIKRNVSRRREEKRDGYYSDY